MRCRGRTSSREKHEVSSTLNIVNYIHFECFYWQHWAPSQHFIWHELPRIFLDGKPWADGGLFRGMPTADGIVQHMEWVATEVKPRGRFSRENKKKTPLCRTSVFRRFQMLQFIQKYNIFKVRNRQSRHASRTTYSSREKN